MKHRHFFIARHSSLFALVIAFTGCSHRAQQLSRAQAVAQALAANPQVKLSLEQVALLEGRIIEARADALPDVSWSTRAIRSRDPGLLEQPELRSVSARNSAPRSSPIPGTLRHLRRRPADAVQLQARQRARAATAGADRRETRRSGAPGRRRRRGHSGYNQLLFAIEQLRVAQSNIDQKQSHVDVARNRRAAGAATELEVLRAEVDLENQRAELLRAETQVAAARARLNTVMFRPTETPD